MTEVEKEPGSTPAQVKRRLREAAALRANLQRRKQQARDRIDQPPPIKPGHEPVKS